jgi:FkbM family methyltransferase
MDISGSAGSRNAPAGEPGALGAGQRTDVVGMGGQIAERGVALSCEARPQARLGASRPASYSVFNVRFGNDPPRRFHFRARTSDECIIDQILIKNQYDLGRLPRRTELRGLLERQRSTGRVPLILDAGANIGAASLFFAAMVPGAVVVAIEPHSENFRLLQMNVAGLPIQAIEAAVSSTPGLARVVDPGEGHWGYRTQNLTGNMTCGNSVPRLTINDIYHGHSARCFPFIVKIDIEGGEADLFSGGTEWVAATPLLIVEPHDRLLPGSGNSFRRCISQLGRDSICIGEEVYSIANDLNGDFPGF